MFVGSEISYAAIKAPEISSVVKTYCPLSEGQLLCVKLLGVVLVPNNTGFALSLTSTKLKNPA